MVTDDAIDVLAAAQHGVVARSQLLAAGVPAGVIDRRLARDRLIRLHAGVFLVGGHPLTWHARLMGATLAGGRGAAVSHRAAARLHGVLEREVPVEITAGLSRNSRIDGAIVHRSGDLAARDVEIRAALPRTRAGRTIIDLAAVVPRPVLERALDDALSRRLVTCDSLTRRLDELGRQGRKGAGTMGSLLAERSGRGRGPESELERRLLTLLRRAGLPLPVPQFEVALPDGRLARLDFAYPDRLLALEADSYRHHSDRLAWAKDHTRNRLLTAMGWRILPVTWGDVTVSPAALLAVVHRGLSNQPRRAG